MVESISVEEVEPSILKQWQDAGRVTIIDVRDAAAHRFERIEGSLLMPLNVFEPGLLPKDQKLIFYCNEGQSCRQAAERWGRAGHSDPYILKGGLKRWIQEKQPTVGDKQINDDLPRFAKITFGGICAIASLLSWFISSIFVIFPLAIGVGFVWDGWKNDKKMLQLLTKYFPKKKP